MRKNLFFIPAISLLTAILFIQFGVAKERRESNCKSADVHCEIFLLNDTVPPDEIMNVIKKVIYSTNDFNIESVADLYTPNAVVADDEPPYSWNGPTAGVQWVNAVEKACKTNRLTGLKGTIAAINFFQQSADNVYIVVPVDYSGDLPRKQRFAVKGAFTFVLRMENGKWMIKSQTWMSAKGFKNFSFTN